MLSRVKIFENEDLSYSCGRAKTKVFKDDDALPHIQSKTLCVNTDFF